MIVLVTGCRSGFGKLIAVAAAKKGHTVYAGLRDLSTSADLESAAEGLSVTPVQLDVTDAEQREAVVRRILDEHGRVDSLINNAGIPLGGPLELLEQDELQKLYDVNVFGVHALTRLVLPSMREQGFGTVIMMSSVAGRMSFPGGGAYASSKFALEGMSEAWRHELKLFGVHVYIVEPGNFRTDIWERNMRVGRNVSETEGPYAEVVGRIGRIIHKMGTKYAAEPTPVVERTVSLIESTDAPFRHPMGKGSTLQTRITALVPFGFLESRVQKVLRGRGN